MAHHVVKSPVTGSVWMHSVSVGERVFEGGQLLVLESMKLEIPIQTPVDGEVVELAPAGTIVNEGDTIAVIDG